MRLEMTFDVCTNNILLPFVFTLLWFSETFPQLYIILK